MHSAYKYKILGKFLNTMSLDVIDCHLTQVIEQDSWRREKEKFIRLQGIEK